jgi:hypothetical protein
VFLYLLTLGMVCPPYSRMSRRGGRGGGGNGGGWGGRGRRRPREERWDRGASRGQPASETTNLAVLEALEEQRRRAAEASDGPAPPPGSCPPLPPPQLGNLVYDEQSGRYFPSRTPSWTASSQSAAARRNVSPPPAPRKGATRGQLLQALLQRERGVSRRGQLLSMVTRMAHMHPESLLSLIPELQDLDFKA